MRRNGSERAAFPATLPAWLSPVMVVLGVAAMLKTAPVAMRLGLRPGLIVSELALMLPGLIVFLLLRRPLSGLLGAPAASPLARWLPLLYGASLWVLSLGLLEVQYALRPPPPGYLEAFRRLHELLRPKDALDLVASLLAIALAPSICEETLFRGLVLPSFVRPLGPLLASLGSALLFGLIHLDQTIYGELSLYRVPFAIAVGLGFAALRLRSGGLLPCMAAHATLNALTFLIAPLTDDPSLGMPEPRPLLGAALLALGLLLAWLTLRPLRLVERPTPAP
jgi:membrane protease YdiL (CAAX protease family)